ncbi:MAG: hypothetical protein ACRDT0_11600 [Pseudonocardiaceae bacterium]
MEEGTPSPTPLNGNTEDHDDSNGTPGHDGAVPGHEDCNGVCGELIRDAAVRSVLITLYTPIDDLAPASKSSRDASEELIDLDPVREWEQIDTNSLEFHRHGSTSFILSGRSKPSFGRQMKFALKCVLFPYSNIAIIASKTASYAFDHNAIDQDGSSVKRMVRVWASTSRWILMDFADGCTLAEEITRLKGNALVSVRGRRLKRTASAAGNVRLDLIRSLGIPLLNALHELQLQGKQHEDLSPSNIIVQLKTGAGGVQEYELTFIDFGQNYLYTRSVGGLEGPDGVFVAPEVRNNETNVRHNADLYSLGRIMIALGDVGENRDGTVPDRFYGQAPLIARLIEDLIDHRPERRLLVFKMASDSKDTYGSLATVLEQELDATQATLVADSRQQKHAVPYDRESLLSSVGILFPLSREPKKRLRIYRVRKRQRILSDPRRSMHGRWLLTFSILASINFYITAFVSVFWFLRDVGIDILNPTGQVALRVLGADPNSIPLIDNLRQSDYQLGQVTENLPARLVGLSFALCGSRYYQNIFGDVTTLVAQSPALKGTPSRLGTEFTIRLMSIWSSWLILSANLVQVRWWPICSAIGYTGVLLANVSSARFATKYLDMARQGGLSTVPPAHQKVTGLDVFGQWGQSMLFYCLVVWAFAIPIYLGILKDVYIYSILVASINIGMFYIIKTGVNALDIRTGLNRCFLAAERLRYVADRGDSLLYGAQKLVR